MSEESAPESILELPEIIIEPTVESDNPPPYDWKKDIHPDVAKDKLWESIPDLKTLTKVAADNARYNIGAIKIPATDAPKEQWDAFHAKLGWPADTSAYTLSEEGAKDPTVVGMRDVAHRARLTPTQWDVMREGYNGAVEEKALAQREEYRAAEDALKAEWGGAYDTNVKRIQKAILHLGGEEALNSVVDKGLGNDVHFLKMMSRMGKALRDERIIMDDTASSGNDPEALKSELTSLTGSEAYLSPYHKDHDQAVARAKTLFEIVYN